MTDVERAGSAAQQGRPAQGPLRRQGPADWGGSHSEPTAANRGKPATVPSFALLSVALVSAALLAYEIVLMRRLLVERWHHFGYLVISVALLGFGVSGTLLALLARRVRGRPGQTLWWSAAGLAGALLVLPRAMAALPVTARFIPDDLWRQAGWWSLYWAGAAIPFLLGATHIGSALMIAGPRVGRVYAVNLFGSAAGAVAGALLVSRFAIGCALWPSLALALAAAALLCLCRDEHVPDNWHGPRRDSWPSVADGHGPRRDSRPSVAARHGPRRDSRPSLRRAGARGVCVALLIMASVGVEVLWPSTLTYDEHKYAATIERLAAQGSARRVAHAADPHGYVEIYESDLFHDLPLLALSKAPPPMFSVLINGDAAGSIFRIDDGAEADVMDRTLMAFPYALLRPRPRVLLIGEIGGTNVWLARRQQAEHIVVIQPNAALVALLRGPLGEASGHVFDRPDVSVLTAGPRAVLRRGSGTAGTGSGRYIGDGRRDAGRRWRVEKYDLIQIVSLEGLGVGLSGMYGLSEDHLATVEGLAAGLRNLSRDGVLSICRGIQSPQRENIRLLATLAEALESIGVPDPARHIVQVRDYLGVCTLALKSPLEPQRRDTLRAAIRRFNLTPVWYAGLPPEEVNQPDVLDGPAGGHVDWLHHAAAEIFSPRREAFYRRWLTNVRPPRDDAPFFWDFYKPAALPVLRQAYGELWLTRAELGRLFLYASLAIAAATGVVLILLPLAVARLGMRRGAAGRGESLGSERAEKGFTAQPAGSERAEKGFTAQPAGSERAEKGFTAQRGKGFTAQRGKGFTAQPGQVGGQRNAAAAAVPACLTSQLLTPATLVYFAAIGLGFMGIEMALISRAIRVLGDPVLASAAVIGGVLVLSGLGSLTGATPGVRRRLGRGSLCLPPIVVAALAGLVVLVAWEPQHGWSSALPSPMMLGLFAAALAYCMGVPMPGGIAALDERAPALVPWAWGVNGVASVLGTSLALVVAMSSGYRSVVALSAALYAVAALAAWPLRGPPTCSGRPPCRPSSLARGWPIASAVGDTNRPDIRVPHL